MNCDYRGPNRNPPTTLQRLNPFWWAVDEQRLLGWPRWRWFLRNPFCNFHNVIIGIAHRSRLVYWSSSPWLFNAEGGWNYGWCVRIEGWLPHPFISYRGKRIEVALGWKPSGAFGYALRRACAANATDTP